MKVLTTCELSELLPAQPFVSYGSWVYLWVMGLLMGHGF